MALRYWMSGALLLAALIGLSPARAAPGPATSRLAVDEGVELRVLTAGPASDRAAIIFVPGWSTGAEVWAGQMAVFGRQRRVVSFDPRSTGQSSIVAWGNTPEQRAHDLDALIRSLDLERPPVIVAWSQGVQDMAAYVERYGDGGLTGIVLVDAAVSRGASGSDEAARDEGRRMLDIYVAHQREYLQGMFAAIISRPQADGAVDALVETGMRTPPAIGRAMLEADLASLDRSAALTKITRPTLVIASARSPELEAQRAMAATVRDGRLEPVDDAAHAVFLDQPDLFASLLQGFLDRVDRTSR